MDQKEGEDLNEDFLRVSDENEKILKNEIFEYQQNVFRNFMEYFRLFVVFLFILILLLSVHLRTT